MKERCINCLSVIASSLDKNYCILCQEIVCDTCIDKNEFMCPSCRITADFDSKQRDVNIRANDILDSLEGKIQKQDYDQVVLLLEAWKNGKISVANQYLDYLEKRLKKSTIQFIKQIENVVCDLTYIVSRSCLEQELTLPHTTPSKERSRTYT